MSLYSCFDQILLPLNRKVRCGVARIWGVRKVTPVDTTCTVTTRVVESESFFKNAGVGVWSRFFELEQFMGWSRNPKKSSDSTSLVTPVNTTLYIKYSYIPLYSQRKKQVPLAPEVLYPPRRASNLLYFYCSSISKMLL